MKESNKEQIENPNMDFTRVMANKEAYFNAKQIQTMLDYCFQNKLWNRFLLFMILFRTGRRITEVLGKPPYSLDSKKCLSNYKGLRPCDIYHKERLIEFDILKKQPVRTTNKDGTKKSDDRLKVLLDKKMPKRKLKAIDKVLYDWIVWYIKEFNIGFEDRILPISRFTARDWLIDVCKKCNIEMNLGFKNVKVRGNIREVRVKPHLHMFRHSFAIYFLKKNSTDPSAVVKVQNLLEHSSMNITAHYMQYTQKDIIDVLDKTFGGK